MPFSTRAGPIHASCWTARQSSSPRTRRKPYYQIFVSADGTLLSPHAQEALPAQTCISGRNPFSSMRTGCPVHVEKRRQRFPSPPRAQRARKSERRNPFSMFLSVCAEGSHGFRFVGQGLFPSPLARREPYISARGRNRGISFFASAQIALAGTLSSGRSDALFSPRAGGPLDIFCLGAYNWHIWKAEEAGFDVYLQDAWNVFQAD